MKGLGPEIQGFEGPLEQAYRFDEIGIEFCDDRV